MSITTKIMELILGFLILLPVLLVLGAWIYGAPDQISWGLPYNDRGYSIDLDSLGNIIVSGSTTENPSQTSAFISKFDQVGNIIWSRKWANTPTLTIHHINIAEKVAVLKGNPQIIDYISVVGVSRLDNTTQNFKSFFLLLDPNGSLQCYWSLWDQNSNSTKLYSLAEDPSPNSSIYLVGISDYSGAIIKFDLLPTCSFSWFKIYPSPINNTRLVFRDAVFYDGSLYVVGHVIYPTGDSDLVLYKIDPSGDVINALVFEAQRRQRGYGIDIDIFGNVILVGMGFNPSPNPDVLAIKLDNNLNFLCGSAIDTGREDIGREVAVDGYGNIHIVGYTSAGPVAAALIVELFPDCSHIQTYRWGNASSIGMDVKVATGSQIQQGVYSLNLYVVGWFEGPFPNPLIVDYPNISSFTPNISIHSPTHIDGSLAFSGGVYGDISGSLNNPQQAETYILKIYEEEPIIDEFNVLYIVIMALATATIFQFAKGWISRYLREMVRPR